MQAHYMLKNRWARRLYAVARRLPIVDYHCHLSAKEIFEDRPFSNIGEMWLGADHYKWRLMRTAGVEERYITGDAPMKEKFLRYCEALELSAGNPLYHWSHMELSRFFDIDLPINGKNAETIWERANERIAAERMSPRKLIVQSRVESLCTTDDIADDLCWHKKLAEEDGWTVRVLPSFRTDNLFLMRRADYQVYLNRLGAAAGVEIFDLDSLERAVRNRADAFAESGCRCADLGIPFFPNRIAEKAEAAQSFSALLAGDAISEEAYAGLVGYLYVFTNGLYREWDWISQWHLAVTRNANSALNRALGADCGVDCVGDPVCGADLIRMLDAIQERSGLPRTVLYSLNDANIAQIASIAGAFPGVRCGAAWWFCDHKRGIEQQLRVIAENGCLGAFYGMLTDSRSFLSYARHDYFRRILCNQIGEWVEAGEFDAAGAETLVRKIAYENIKEGLDV